MIVYLDILFLTEFITDGLLILATSSVLKQKISLIRGILGASIGALYKVFCTIYSINFAFVSTAVAFLMTFTVFSHQRFVSCAIFILLSATTGGIVQGLGYNGYTYASIFLISVISAPFVCDKVKDKLKLTKLRYKVEISAFGNQVKLFGFADSGNMMNIAVIGENTAKKLLGKDEILRMKNKTVGNYSLILTETVHGKELIPVFEPQKILVDGTEHKIKVGVMFSKLEDVILPREFILKEHIADVEETFV